jgi:hypothetical protein
MSVELTDYTNIGLPGTPARDHLLVLFEGKMYISLDGSWHRA